MRHVHNKPRDTTSHQINADSVSSILDVRYVTSSHSVAFLVVHFVRIKLRNVMC